MRLDRVREQLVAARVETVRRLVEQDQPRCGQEAQRESDTLALPHRKPVDALRPQLVEIEPLGCCLDDPSARLARHVHKARAEVEVEVDGEARVQAGLSRRHEAHAALILACVGVGRDAVDRDPARVGRDEPGENSQQRRLSGAVLAGKSRDPTAVQHEVDGA